METIRPLNEGELRRVVDWQSECLQKIANMVGLNQGFTYSELIERVKSKVKD